MNCVTNCLRLFEFLGMWNRTYNFRIRNRVLPIIFFSYYRPSWAFSSIFCCRKCQPSLHLSIFKGIVQRKSTGVECGISRKVFLSHWTADILFFNLKRTFSLNRKKPVLAAKAKICGLSNSMGRPLQITDSGKPTSWWRKKACRYCVDSGNKPHAANKTNY